MLLDGRKRVEVSIDERHGAGSVGYGGRWLAQVGTQGNGRRSKPYNECNAVAKTTFKMSDYKG